MSSFCQGNPKSLAWGPWSSLPETEAAMKFFRSLCGWEVEARGIQTEEDEENENGIRLGLRRYPWVSVALESLKEPASRRHGPVL